METYESMLLETDGGIFDRHAKTNPGGGANVVIGLGGTGCDAAMKLKKEVYGQLRPDSQEISGPVYRHVRFLLIDADLHTINDCGKRCSDIDASKEFLYLEPETVRGTEELLGTDREAGHLVLTARIEKVYQRIKDMLQTLISDSGLTIHICAGISGRTGGTFLEICYLIRRILGDLGRHDAMICGYFFLPDVNLAVPAVRADLPVSSYIMANGFAALKELDHCMDLEGKEERFRLDYGSVQIEDSRKPVDLCFLVSAEDGRGNRHGGPYDHAVNAVAGFILCLMKSDMRSWGIPKDDWSDRKYYTLGFSEAKMPTAEMASFLGERLFGGWMLEDRIPGEQEKNKLLQELGLNDKELWRELSEGCAKQIEFPADLSFQTYMQCGGVPFQRVMWECLKESREKTEKKSKALMEEAADVTDWREETPSAGEISLIRRTCRILCEKYLMDTRFGPFYVREMLFGPGNENLLREVEMLIYRNREDIYREEAMERQLNERHKETVKMLDSTGFLNRNKKFAEYQDTLNELYRHYCRTELLKILDCVLQTYKEQLLRLDRKVLSPLADMMEAVHRTFRRNMSFLAGKHSIYSGCGVNRFLVDSMRKQLFEAAEKVNIWQAFYKLMDTVLDHYPEWADGDEERIAGMIAGFIFDTYAEILERPIDEHIRRMLRSGDLYSRVQLIEEIFLNLQDTSLPLFNMGFEYSGDYMRNVLMVPAGSGELLEAAYHFADREGCIVKETDGGDRIFMIQISCEAELPFWREFAGLQEEYGKNKNAGKHMIKKMEKGAGTIVKQS